jgi:O-antigen/teichoic acid export membrane protein
MSVQIEISKRLVAVNAISTAVRRVLSITVLVWLQQFLLRRISAEEYVLLPVLMSVMMFVPLLTTLINSGMGRFVTEAYAKGDEDRVTQIVTTMLPIFWATALLLVTVGGLLAWQVEPILRVAPEQVREAQIMILLLFANAAFGIATTPYGLGINVRQKILTGNLISLGVEVTRIVLLLLCLNLISVQVVWVVASTVTAQVLGQLVIIAYSRHLVPSLTFRRGAFRRDVVGAIVGFGSWATLGQVAAVMREASDNLILKRFSTAEATTAFAVGASVDFHLRRTVFEAAGTAITPLTAMHATDQEDRLRRSYFRLSRYTLWMLAFCAAPLIVFREQLIALYLREAAPTYAATATVMGLLLARLVAVFPNSALTMVAIARNELKTITLRSLLVETVNLALTLYLVGVLAMGAVGSALSTFLVTSIGVPLLYWSFGLDLVGGKWRDWMRHVVFPGLVPALVAVPVWLAFEHYGTQESWLALGSQTAVGLALYFAVLLTFCLKPDERADLRRLITSRW